MDFDVDLRAQRCRRTREFRTGDEKAKPTDDINHEARIKAHRKRIQKQLKKIKNRN